MNRKMLCELYDSENAAEGQAYNVQLSTEFSGWKELNFTILKTVRDR